MWKLYLIETLGNVSSLAGFIAFISSVTTVVGFIGYINADEFFDSSETIRSVKKVTKTSMAVLIASVCLSCLIPSKKFMYTTFGVYELIEFIKGNEQVKDLSSKTLQIIDKKLDSFLDDSE